MDTNKWTTDYISNMKDKVVIITGANSGIGFEATKALARKGAKIVLACRSLSKGQDALKELTKEFSADTFELMYLDLASQKSIAAFADSFTSKYDRLDLLLNNAGIMSVPYGLTEDGFEKQFGTNHLGHFALTGLLLESIKKTPNSRVVTMSSGAHTMARVDFKNLQYEGGKGYIASTAYGRSKLSNLLFAYKLQQYFEENDISATSLAAHPGGANTNLNSHMGKSFMGKIMMPLMNRMFQSAEMGALPILRAATDPDALGGQYYGPDSFTGNSGYPVIVKSNKKSYNKIMQTKLWQVSEELTGVRY